jgi:hypothetical protein
MEIEEIVGWIKTRHQDLIPDRLSEVSGSIAALCGGWTRHIELKLFSCEDALNVD